jgi:hypothetical protein
LDLVFNFYKVNATASPMARNLQPERMLMLAFQVYAILDEVFLAGEIEETSKQVVLTRLEHLDKLE